MSFACPIPPVEEQAVGMEVYATSDEGMGGAIKTIPEDFQVEEIVLLPPPGYGKHIITRVASYNWETNALLNELAHYFHISHDDIGIAGMKDKRAVTVQLMSFPVDIDRLSSATIKGVTIEVLYRSLRPIYRGQLKGNRFKVIVRGVKGNMKCANRVSAHIIAKRGVPNFFGIQRFGIIRPVTHLVGKYIIATDFENAVMSYAANPIQGEPSLSFGARQFLEETRDFVGALKRFPRNMQFERILVNHLAVHQDDWVGALGRLPLNLLRLFVHAYQSYIFNRILSRRIKKNIPLQEAVVGDVVIPVERLDRKQNRGIEVTNRNLDKVNRQIVKGNCYPTAPLIGYNTQLARGTMGDIERAIFDEEQIDPSKFQVHGFPQLASQGIRRMVMSPVTNLRLSFQDQKLFLAFSLKKGSYATSLLREFMKSPIMNY